MNESELTFAYVYEQLWDHFAPEEIIVNGKCAWSDNAVDCFYGEPDYDDICNRYNKKSKECMLEDYKNFRVTEINLKVDSFHHTVVNITGYFLYDLYEVYSEEDDMYENFESLGEAINYANNLMADGILDVKIVREHHGPNGIEEYEIDPEEEGSNEGYKN